jgi:hypothetical protein
MDSDGIDPVAYSSDFVKELETRCFEAETLLELLTHGIIFPLDVRVLRGLRTHPTCADLVASGVGPAPSVRRCLARLLQLKLIEVAGLLPPRDDFGRGRQRNVYRLALSSTKGSGEVSGG